MRTPNPDSLLNMVRRQLAALLDPVPPAETGWCVYCPVNHGNTAVLTRDELMDHMELHVGRHETVRVQLGLHKATHARENLRKLSDDMVKDADGNQEAGIVVPPEAAGSFFVPRRDVPEDDR